PPLRHRSRRERDEAGEVAQARRRRPRAGPRERRRRPPRRAVDHQPRRGGRRPHPPSGAAQRGLPLFRRPRRGDHLDPVRRLASRRRALLPVADQGPPRPARSQPRPRRKGAQGPARCQPVIPRLGVFWDFGSLHQHPDPANGDMRTEEQNALFKQGLGCLGTLYSHPKTWVLRLTSFPDGHKAEDQAEGTNVAKYFDRGWCFTEQSWASLTKSGHLSLDLGKMRAGKEYYLGSLVDDCRKEGGRRPPLLPSAFAAELETKSFTNGKDDKPLVKRLYEDAFQEQFGKATELDYKDLGWGDAEAAQLAEVLASGAAPRLEELNLSYNTIGDEGCKALAAA
uniref:Uncharacterized protein n=2 Tax=Emiliania huxleyi TaxID=2903 RepID=A0A0D3KW40_EMIH1